MEGDINKLQNPTECCIPKKIVGFGYDTFRQSRIDTLLKIVPGLEPIVYLTIIENEWAELYYQDDESATDEINPKPNSKPKAKAKAKKNKSNTKGIKAKPKAKIMPKSQTSNKNVPNKHEPSKYRSFIEARIKELRKEIPGLESTEYIKVAAKEWNRLDQKNTKSKYHDSVSDSDSYSESISCNCCSDSTCSSESSDSDSY